MRSRLFPVLAVAIALILMGRLFYLQVLNNKFDLLSQQISVQRLYDYPERGYIYDRNGTLLVANQASYDVMVIPREVEITDTLEFCRLLKIDRETFNITLAKARIYSPRLPSVFIAQLEKKDYAVLQEKMWKYKGFYIQRRSIRDYRTPSAANILGYISEVNPYDLQQNKYYQSGELIGRQGIEKVYEHDLRGTKGVRYLQKDNFNRVIGSFKEGSYDTLPSKAADLTLTIDIQLQAYAQELMQNKRGGIVAIEPSSGEVLALVSTPTYEPNLLVGRNRSQNFNALQKDTINKPLFDRGLQGVYPPGSPFKLINGLIALQENVVNLNTKITCYGGHYYAKGQFMGCHCDPGTTNDLNKAIYNSCNTFFANAYRKSIEKFDNHGEGLNQWANYVKGFGFGDYLGYDLPTGQKGYVPTADFYDRWYPNKSWRAVTTLSNGIGQGELLTTPIQLANMAATIANRGHYFKPHFVKSISNRTIDSTFTTPMPTGIKPEYFEPVIEGMKDVVLKGTARIAQIQNIEVCGKTGTAENFTRIGQKRVQLTDHSVFIAFAPKDDPKIAIAVFVENGYWGARWAAPIASLIIEKHIFGTVKRTSLENRMIEGSLEKEYSKPLSSKPFNINE